VRELERNERLKDVVLNTTIIFLLGKFTTKYNIIGQTMRFVIVCDICNWSDYK
jgi:hypothetical protein